MTYKEVMQMALDALQYNLANWQGKDKTIEALRAALAQPEPEPVATLILGGIVDGEFDDNEIEIDNSALERLQEILVKNCDAVHLDIYTAPPQRKPLSDEDKAILEAVHRELDDQDYSGDAPGHSHRIPGIWDSDNGDKAGEPCAWCLTWKKFTALIEREKNT